MVQSVGNSLIATRDLWGVAIPFFWVLVIVVGCCCCLGVRCYVYHYNHQDRDEDFEPERSDKGGQQLAQSGGESGSGGTASHQVALEMNNTATLGSSGTGRSSVAKRTSDQGSTTSGWTKLRDRMGREFFFNQDTGESRWTDPNTAKDHNLPDGWQEMHDPAFKRPYFYNAKTGESTWHRPEAP